jgi:hypothetical protein
MDFGAIEQEIVDHLRAKITDQSLSIIVIPEDEVEILPPAGKSQIIVAFSGEDSESGSNLSYDVQDTSIVFSLLLQGKRLRGNGGLYPLAETVKSKMIGFTPSDCRTMSYSSHKFVKNDKKIFEYVLDFKTETTRVSTVEEPEVNGQFKEVTYYTNEKV